MRVWLCKLLMLLCLVLGYQVKATDDPFELALEQVLELELTGAAVRNLELDNRPQTANPFRLTALELPFSIDVISRSTMRARGLKSVTEAADNLVGVISGESPAEPSSFSIRGFSRDSVTILRDGIKLGPASMTMRPHNTFNLQQIDIVRGPATVEYGHGSASGFINMITRKPKVGEQSTIELFAAIAKFDSTEFGLGLSGDIDERSAFRIDINQSQSDGWVNDTFSKSLNATASALWQVSDETEVSINFDYLKDDLPAYWGTPLVTSEFAQNPISSVIQTRNGTVLEQSMRFDNYNVADNRSDSEHLWTRVTVDWQFSDDIKVSNTSFWFNADRAWQNAESYVFNPESQQIDRDRFFVFHEHEYKGNQLSLNYDHDIADMTHSIKLTLDYNHTNFVRSRGFPDGDSVSALNPDAGLFGSLIARESPTTIETWSINLENSLQISPQLRLFGGIRTQHTHLNRENYDTQGIFISQDSFARTFKPLSYHINGHYQLSDNQALYLQYSTAHDPVGSNIFLADANENFEFTDIRQIELGYKAIVDVHNIEWTATYFDIERSNILLLMTHDSVSNAGIQTGKGVELAITAQPSVHWRLGGNLAYNHARYQDFVDPDFGINASGNTPPNVPEFVANAWMSLSDVAGLELEVGGGLRYVSERYTNFQNSAKLLNYLTANLFAAYGFNGSRLVVSVRNAFDEDYAPWADIFYANQVGIASGRTVELSWQALF